MVFFISGISIASPLSCSGPFVSLETGVPSLLTETNSDDDEEGGESDRLEANVLDNDLIK